MVDVEYADLFDKKFKRIKNTLFKLKLKKQISKIISHPKTGKPMRHGRKGTREVYIGSYRFSYAYFEKEDIIYFLDIYHKDEQ